MIVELMVFKNQISMKFLKKLLDPVSIVSNPGEHLTQGFACLYALLGVVRKSHSKCRLYSGTSVSNQLHLFNRTSVSNHLL